MHFYRRWIWISDGKIYRYVGAEQFGSRRYYRERYESHDGKTLYFYDDLRNYPDADTIGDSVETKSPMGKHRR